MTTVRRFLQDLSDKNPLGPGDSMKQFLQHPHLNIVILFPPNIGAIHISTFSDDKINIILHLIKENIDFVLPDLHGECTISQIHRAVQNPLQTWLYAIDMITVSNRATGQAWIAYKEGVEAYLQAMDCNE